MRLHAIVAKIAPVCMDLLLQEKCESDGGVVGERNGSGTAIRAESRPVLSQTPRCLPVSKAPYIAIRAKTG